MLEMLLEGFVKGLVGAVQLLRLVPAWVLAGLAWAIALLAFWNLFAASRDTVKRSKTLHQIPCANCRFFTHDYRLKCTVHPDIALTEGAIGCKDFEKKTD